MEIHGRSGRPDERERGGIRLILISLDVELAMSIVQLTGVLIPLLLGITRYYRNNEGRHISEARMLFVIALLFCPLFLLYSIFRNN